VNAIKASRQRKLFDKKENIRFSLFLSLLTFLDIIGILVVRRGINSSFFLLSIDSLKKRDDEETKGAHYK